VVKTTYHLIARPPGKRTFGSHVCRLEDNNRMDLISTGWEGVKYIYQAQTRDNWWTLQRWL
jgi:hypothetical protein